MENLLGHRPLVESHPLNRQFCRRFTTITKGDNRFQGEVVNGDIAIGCQSP